MRKRKVEAGEINEALLAKAQAIDAALIDLLPEDTDRLAALALIVTRFMKIKGAGHFELQLMANTRLSVTLKETDGSCICGNPNCENNDHNNDSEVKH